MRQGTYAVQLVTDQGEKVDKDVKDVALRVRATQPPTITKIVPHPSYPDGGLYSFEIQGENFGYEASENVIKIDDVQIDFGKRTFTNRPSKVTIDDDCKRKDEGGSKFPCLVGNRRQLKVFGFSPDKRRFGPMHVVVEVDKLESAPKLLNLSWVQRGTPAVIAFAVLAVLALLVYLVARQKAAKYRPFDKRYSTLAYLLIDQETNTYSLSRLQLLAWTAAAVLAYMYVGASQDFVQWKWQLPEVPEGLPTLLGLSVGTTALAIGATGARGSKGAGTEHPGVGDFITNGGVFASERLQFFVWTILGVVGFVGATLVQDPATLTELPKIPDSFLPLMGVSSLGYLAGKVLRKPGPIVKQVDRLPAAASGAAAPANGLRILGENLSPRAQVFVNDERVASSDIRPATQVTEGEFATELVVTALSASAAAAAKHSVRVLNPDGQSAQI
jgi:hypothetical protein